MEGQWRREWKKKEFLFDSKGPSGKTTQKSFPHSHSHSLSIPNSPSPSSSSSSLTHAHSFTHSLPLLYQNLCITNASNDVVFATPPQQLPLLLLPPLLHLLKLWARDNGTWNPEGLLKISLWVSLCQRYIHSLSFSPLSGSDAHTHKHTSMHTQTHALSLSLSLCLKHWNICHRQHRLIW